LVKQEGPPFKFVSSRVPVFLDQRISKPSRCPPALLTRNVQRDGFAETIFFPAVPRPALASATSTAQAQAGGPSAGEISSGFSEVFRRRDTQTRRPSRQTSAYWARPLPRAGAGQTAIDGAWCSHNAGATVSAASRRCNMCFAGFNTSYAMVFRLMPGARSMLGVPRAMERWSGQLHSPNLDCLPARHVSHVEHLGFFVDCVHENRSTRAGAHSMKRVNPCLPTKKASTLQSTQDVTCSGPG